MAQQSKLHKQRVKIGVEEDGTPIIRWASGRTIDDLNDSIVQIYIDSGLLGKFKLPNEISECIAPQKKTPCFHAYSAEWIARYKESSLKGTTLSGYLSYLRKHLNPEFGEMQLHQITVNDIQDFMNDREDLSRKTIREFVGLLSQILDSAIEDRHIDMNPAQSKRLMNPSDKVKVRDALPLDDVIDIIMSMSTLNANDLRLLSLLLFTGMRRGEVLGLRWEDIDLENRLISVKRNVTFEKNQPTVTTTKTKNGVRKIPLDPQLVRFLSMRTGTSGYIVGGKSPISLTTYRNTFIRISKKVDLHNATAHIFRHSYLTLLDQAGVAPKTLQLIAGHGDIKTTMNRYVHGNEKEVLAAGSKFNQFLFASEEFKSLVSASPRFKNMLVAS